MKNQISKDIDKLILKYGLVAVKDFIKSAFPITELDPDTLIKGTLNVKPITGDIIGFCDGKPVFKK